MADPIQMGLVNLEALINGVDDAKRLSLRYERTELKRGAQRIRKTFINEQLKGPPGIKAGKLARGKNIWTYATGNTHKDLYAKIGISRILHVHEKGITLPMSGKAKSKSGLLYLHKKGKTSPIIAVVKSVRIPKRLNFKGLVLREAPKELANAAKAAARGVEEGLSKQLKKNILGSVRAI